MPADLPGFDKAEYINQISSPTSASLPCAEQPCARCDRDIATRYFLVNDRPMCEPCADLAVTTPQPGRNVAFTRAILFGAAAAFLGLFLYAAIEILTGWVIGYAAIGVGYLVGKAIKKGSGGRGGPRYQVAAALLTYAAVSMAAIPVGIHSYFKHHAAVSAPTSASTSGHRSPGSSPESPVESPVESPDKRPDSVADSSTPGPSPKTGHPTLHLLVLGLASPFLDLSEGAGGLIGIFILFIGIRAAWALTAGSEVLVAGPYTPAPTRDASFSNP